VSVETDPGSRASAGPEACPLAELARRMIDLGEAPPTALPAAGRLALAWELKDLCYAAWSSEPQRASKAAEALRRLCAGDFVDLAPPENLLETEALAAWTEGIAFLARGEMTEATQRFDHAAEVFRALGQDYHATQTQVPKIMALSILGRYDQAAECAESAQREFIAHGDLRAASKVSLNLGTVHLRRDAYADSVSHYRQAAVLFARVGDHEHSVMADIGIADALMSMGDFDEALRIYARARMRSGTHGFPVLEAKVEESVALLQLARGRYREALASFELARRRYEQLAMPQNLANDEKQLADTYLELRLLPESLALFDQALAKFQTLNMPDEQAWTLLQRGRALALQGHPDQATDSFVSAAGLFASLDIGVGLSGVSLARAELALANGDAANAVELAAQAAAGFAAAGFAEGRFRADVVRANALLRAGSVGEARVLFDATLVRARELQLLTLQVRCLTGLGLAAQALGDPAAADAAFNAAIELFEDQRRALPGDELRIAFLTEHLRPYQELLRMALQAHAHAAAPELAAQVLVQLDRFRARALGERLAQGASIEDNASTQGLRDRLNWLYRRAQRVDQDGEFSAALTDELRRTEQELLERARRARLAAPAPDRARVGDDYLDVETLQDLLGEDGAMVEYGVQDNELFACVVTRAGVALQRHVAHWPEVLEAVHSARFQIETLRHGAASVARHMATLTERAQMRMRRLHTLVWAPLAAALAQSRRVLIIPHAQLGSLPFAALDDGKCCLGQRYELALAPSARVALRGFLRQPASALRALVLGESTRLPHAAVEARLVAGLFPQAAVYVGDEATLDALRAHAGDADVIHLACHAQFRSDNPMFSALYLHDGALTAEEVEALSLGPCTVVLSACETGLAEHGSGDESIGLVRAFLVAGAARVLASLWPVDDEITAGFMSQFYGALCRGSAPAAALQIAQAEVMRRHPHPFFWAAFTLHGRW
jgi:CHAT domain-containing protein/tetratricopeptide (TPR) repeat protein